MTPLEIINTFLSKEIERFNIQWGGISLNESRILRGYLEKAYREGAKHQLELNREPVTEAIQKAYDQGYAEARNQYERRPYEDDST